MPPVFLLVRPIFVFWGQIAPKFLFCMLNVVRLPLTFKVLPLNIIFMGHLASRKEAKCYALIFFFYIPHRVWDHVVVACFVSLYVAFHPFTTKYLNVYIVPGAECFNK